MYIILFYYSRFKNYYNSIIYIVTTMCFLIVLWLTNGGLYGSIPTLYFIGLAIFISISKPKHHLLILITIIGCFLTLTLLEFYVFKEFVLKYVNAETKAFDIIFGYVTSLIVVYLLLNVFKKNYDLENRKLSDQTLELQKLNTSKDLFLNILAHDLRNPFSSILGLTRIMADKTEDLSVEQYQKYSQLTRIASERAYELLDSLLEWGRIQQNNIQVELRSIQLKPVVEQLKSFYQDDLVRKEIEVNIQVSDKIQVLSELYLLQTVMRNLISNAIKFTPRKGKIKISAKTSGDMVAIVISDTGIGMNQEMVDNLFRIDTGTNRKGTEGESTVGLGLIISKQLVKKSGGDLQVESEVGKGSKFTFTVSKS